MIIRNSLSLEEWLKGISYEVAFWNNVYRWKHTFNGMMCWSHYGRQISLEHFDANAYLSKCNNPIVLDVGAGMSYATGNYVLNGGELLPLDVHYVDPLAPYFNDILKRYRRKLPTIEFGMMEYLSDFYPERNIDMVIIQNALDHSSAPQIGIIEAVQTLKIGGVLYLNHHPNEAEMEHYKGFHQFNINHEDGKLIIWNRKSRVDVNDMLKCCADISVNVNEDTGHVIAVIYKTADIPTSLHTNNDRKELLSTIINMSKKQSELSHTLHYKARYWMYNAIQFFAQLLPWHIKMKLKRILHQA